MIQAFKKRIYGPIMQAWCKHYFKKPRNYQYADIKGVVLPGVFFPHFTVSTSVLIDYLFKQELTNKKVLELGCGSGLASVAAAKKGAIVIASDVNPKAIENVRLNAEMNAVRITTVLSNLFESLGDNGFDYIIINPPYYPKEPLSDSERAWFCGEEFEYFQDLFMQIPLFLTRDNKVILILSEDCDIMKIGKLASEKGICLDEIERVKRKGELNMIYELNRI